MKKKILQKLDKLKRTRGMSFGWVEQKYCFVCDYETYHSVYLTDFVDGKYTMHPTRIYGFICDSCGNLYKNEKYND